MEVHRQSFSGTLEELPRLTMDLFFGLRDAASIALHRGRPANPHTLGAVDEVFQCPWAWMA